MTRVHPIDPSQPDTSLLSRAAVMIRAGELVAYPTETFYGLAADPRNPQSVDRIFEAKGRPEKQSLSFDTVEINPAIDDARFKMPATKPAEAPKQD